MIGVYAILTVSVTLGAASPYAQYVNQLNFASRISDNIYEDAHLDVPELVRKYGYPLEEHSVKTEDGYILTMHRIPHGRDENTVPQPKKPVVLLMHGLLSSSADFVVMGPGNGLGYILAQEGFDVWMGNARGNSYSRKHVRLNPDSILNTAFWDFSWDEIGNFDLPAMIDYALKYTKEEKIHYIGHSQGTTSFFVMGSLRPEYNNKISSMHAMAPVAYMAHNRNLLFTAIAPYVKDLAKLGRLFGTAELLPSDQIMSWAGQALCKDESVFQPICNNLLFLLVGWDVNQLNTTMLPVILGHSPAGSSTLQIAHYAQGIADKVFRRLDYGMLKNIRLYGSIYPPKYDLRKVTAPVFLHYSGNDRFAEVPDVTRLFQELGAPVGLFRVSDACFNHIDYTWGIDAKALVYNKIISFMRAMAKVNTTGNFN